MGVKYGYEKDKNGRPIEVITEYVDDGLEVIYDMNELTDYEEIESESDTTPPSYKVPITGLLDEDDGKDESDDYTAHEDDLKMWKTALFLALTDDEDTNTY